MKRGASETGVATGMNTVMRTLGGVVGALILTADTIGRTSIQAESAFVTAVWTSAVAAPGAAAFAFLVTPRRPKPRLIPLPQACT